MRPSFHPSLVNGRFGDPALFVETLHRRSAILFDLGDLSALSSRGLLRVEHVFVTHAHMDHFIGFDQLLRVSIGREKRITLVGPTGMIDRVHHKLLGYEWNLAERYAADLLFIVIEVDANLATRTAQFSLRKRFARHDVSAGRATDGVVIREPNFSVSVALLDHRTLCLGYALAEPLHVNIWRNRLAELGLPTGPWLQDLKRAVVEGRPEDCPIHVDARVPALNLGVLRSAFTVTPGQKLVYVTDVADTPANREAIVALARGADLLFIESRFAAADAHHAAERAHLTTTAAGWMAREAGVRRVEAFHFSPRYEGREAQMLGEVAHAFDGTDAPAYRLPQHFA